MHNACNDLAAKILVMKAIMKPCIDECSQNFIGIADEESTMHISFDVR